MTDIAKRTPGPWSADDEDTLNGMVFIPIVGPDGSVICEVQGELDETNDRFVITPKCRSDAAFIVLAERAFEPMRAALKQAYSRLDGGMAATRIMIEEALALGDAAIATGQASAPDERGEG